MKSVKNKLKSDMLSRIALTAGTIHGFEPAHLYHIDAGGTGYHIPRSLYHALPRGIEIFIQIISKNQTNLRMFNDEISKK